eukprot:5247691-Ditylum_brightwellii.AAC.1
MERRSGLSWYQMTAILWVTTALIKNLGIGRHVHLDPVESATEANTFTPRSSAGRRAKQLNPNRRRIAIVRPFDPAHAEVLLGSLERWGIVKPCGGSYDEQSQTWVGGHGYYEYGENYSEEERPIVDLVLSFSRTYADLIGFDTLSSVRDLFEAHDGWGCFSDLVPIASNIEPELDIYVPSAVQTNPLWANGPNNQFLKSYTQVKTKGYDAMVVMETDVQPQVNGWLDMMLSEIKKNEPFVILGSKYDGHSWDNYRDEMPPALVDHLNGNAIFNVTHPLMEDI